MRIVHVAFHHSGVRTEHHLKSATFAAMLSMYFVIEICMEFQEQSEGLDVFHPQAK